MKQVFLFLLQVRSWGCEIGNSFKGFAEFFFQLMYLSLWLIFQFEKG